MDIAKVAISRYTTKAYDPNKRIDEDLIEQLKVLLRFSPSSVNSQPWHFFIASTDEGKGKIATAAASGPYAANGTKIQSASHVIVLCARNELDEQHLQAVLAQEERDGRFPTDEGKAAQLKGRNFYVNLHQNELLDTEHWMEKQVYLALGTLLFGAATLGIDATPIEGFDRAVLDEVLGLKERGLHAVVLAALGYRSADDFNATLPKSRLAEESVISSI